MEKLTEKQRDTVSKTSTTRIVAKLIQFGYSEEDVGDLERKPLLDIYAQALIDGKDKGPPTSKAATALGYDVEPEKRRLEFQMQQFTFERENKHAKKLV